MLRAARTCGVGGGGGGWLLLVVVVGVGGGPAAVRCETLRFGVAHAE